MKFRLACPACGPGGGWLVRAEAETWTAPGGGDMPMVAGECSRCGSLVLMAPTDDAIAQIAFRERERRERTVRARQSLAVVEAPRG